MDCFFSNIDSFLYLADALTELEEQKYPKEQKKAIIK